MTPPTTCASGKQSFESAGHARRIARRVNERRAIRSEHRDRRDRRVTAYECPLCGSHHLGRRPRRRVHPPPIEADETIDLPCRVRHYEGVRT